MTNAEDLRTIIKDLESDRIEPTAVASPEDERRLIERASAATKTFDAQPAQDAELDDLALELFTLSYRNVAIAEDVLAENSRPLEQQLAALGFLDRLSMVPTNAGVLLFGKDPRRTLPGAYVQLARVDGVDLAADILMDHEVATIPQFVLRELFLNAVMHRDYQSTKPIRVYVFSDHLEIQNPGGLYGEATPGNFPEVNAYRNPVIADALKTLGFVNRFGRGVLRAQQLLKQNGNPAAEFHLESHSVTVDVRYP